MARPLRPLIKDGWYHVTARGNRRQDIYRQDRDRGHFLELLGKMVERHAIEVHGCTGLSLRGLGESAGHLDYSAVGMRLQSLNSA